MDDFIGVKIALMHAGEVLVIQRDDKPGLRFAGMWDFPGGGRENSETPFECAARETKEELGIDIQPTSVIWEKTYPAMHDPDQTAYFMAATITQTDLNNIVFGDEGQGWKMMKINDLLDDSTVVEPMKIRMQDYLAASR